MLRVSTIYAASATATANYYTQYLTDTPGEQPGDWHGRQAALLGLGGDVTTDALELLLTGHDPSRGTPLGRPFVDTLRSDGTVIRAVAGFDATFSAPKSVSVLWALTGDDGLARCHDVAVSTAIDYLERHGATTRVRSNGGREHLDTHGLITASFRQTTSRADDPQLHTHVVISNKVQTHDGRWLALDGRVLKQHQRALGGLYQSVLRAELAARYGVAFDEIVNGQAEIAGVPEELLERFSKRTAEIGIAMRDKLTDFYAREGRDPTRFERAALEREAAADTRSHKTGAAVTDLRTRWLDEAAEVGVTPSQLIAEIQAAARSHPDSDQQLSVSEVLSELAERRSTWHRMDVLRTICDVTSTQPGIDGTKWMVELDRAVDEVLAQCVSLDPPTDGASRRTSDGRSVWLPPVTSHMTSEQVILEEDAIITWAIECSTVRPSPSQTLEVGQLDILQAEAAADVAGQDPLTMVVGPAGAGKTTMLRAAVDDLGRQTRPVYGLAPTAKAARVLQEGTGMACDTVAKLLYEWRQPDRPSRSEWRLAPGTTVIVDEAGMLNTADLRHLIRLSREQQWRIALVGDPHQLQAVGRGGMFAELCDMGRVVELERLHRFDHAWEAAASLRIRHGDPSGLDMYESSGRIVAGRFDEHLDTIADYWQHHSPHGRVAITTMSNDHVAAINDRIQQTRIEVGQLGARSGEIADGRHAHVGDTVVTRRNCRSLVTTGDDHVRNRDYWTVTHIGDNGGLTASRIDGHGSVTLPADYAHEFVQLGYAATEPGNQSDDAHRAITLVSPATTCRGLYVAITRGRAENMMLVVTDTHDVADAREVLDCVLVNDRADLPAIRQRRELAELQPRRRHVAPTPRCQIPAWFEDARTRVADRISSLQVRLDDLDSHRKQAAQDLAAAEGHVAQADERLVGYDQHVTELRHDVDRLTAEITAAAYRVNTSGILAGRRARAHRDELTTNRSELQAALEQSTKNAAPLKTDQIAAWVQRQRAAETVDRIETAGAEVTLELTEAIGEHTSLTTWNEWALGKPVEAEALVGAIHSLTQSAELDHRNLAGPLADWCSDNAIIPTGTLPDRAPIVPRVPSIQMPQSIGVEIDL